MKNNFILKDTEYLSYVKDILEHHIFLEMDNYRQHGQTSTMDHCINVSYLSYKYCKKHGLDYKSAARAALLHDLFLYDWHTCRREKGIHLHGLIHPKTALKNALKHFSLSPKEKDIILKHMWPVTIIPPRSKEGYVVMFFDKYSGLSEMVEEYFKRFQTS